jgi:hypothetical protein
MSAPTHPTPTPTPEWGAQPPTPNPKKKRPIMRVVGLVIGGLLGGWCSLTCCSSSAC